MNEASDQLYPAEQALPLYKRLFKKELDFYDMVEMLPIILRRTGTIATKDFLYKSTITDFKVDLPCNVYAIESVHFSMPYSFYKAYLGIERNVLKNYDLPDFMDNKTSDEVVEIYEFNKNLINTPLGKKIDFNNENNDALKFDFNNVEVDIIYIGTVTDKEGVPMVPYKTLEAICYFMHFLDVQADFYRQLAPMYMKQSAEQDSDNALARARTPDFISDNQMDAILNTMTSFNRKKHNRKLRG
jgi:hypothetical protein